MNNFASQNIANIWTLILKTSPPSNDISFFNVGGSSLLALALLEQIRQRLGWRISMTQFINDPTINGLVREGERQGTIHAEELMVKLSNRGSNQRVIFIHPVSGLLFSYSKLVSYLGKDRGCYGIQSPLFAGRDAPSSLEEAASLYADTIFAELGDEPFNLAGWSVGGVIAFEMARKAADTGINLKKLVLIDAYLLPQPDKKDDSLLTSFRADLVSQLTSEDKTPGTQTDATEDIAHLLFGNTSLLSRESQHNFVAQIYDSYMTYHRICSGYLPSPAPVNGLLIHTSENDTTHLWRHISNGGIETCQTAGNHYSITDDQHVAEVATAITNYLD